LLLIMGHVSVIEEDACQVQKGCRYDKEQFMMQEMYRKGF